MRSSDLGDDSTDDASSSKKKQALREQQINTIKQIEHVLSNAPFDNNQSKNIVLMRKTIEDGNIIGGDPAVLLKKLIDIAKVKQGGLASAKDLLFKGKFKEAGEQTVRAAKGAAGKLKQHVEVFYDAVKTINTKDPFLPAFSVEVEGHFYELGGRHENQSLIKKRDSKSAASDEHLRPLKRSNSGLLFDKISRPSSNIDNRIAAHQLMESLYARDLVDVVHEADQVKIFFGRAPSVITSIAETANTALSDEEKADIHWFIHKFRSIQPQPAGFVAAFKEVEDILCKKPLPKINDNDYQRFRQQCVGIHEAYVAIESQKVNRPK